VTIIPDASVIVPVLLNEVNSVLCQKTIQQSPDRIHLDFTLIEVSNALRSGVARARISKERSLAAYEELQAICENPIRANDYLERAFTLALQINHSVYDCLYAIAARENDATLVTCDAKFAAKLDPQTFKVQVL
jgi:predicted nucleic acid-binding protein